MGLSNLPPGVTDAMIEAYFSGPCEDCLDDRHEDCMGQDGDCRCDDCAEAAREDAAEAAREARDEWNRMSEDAVIERLREDEAGLA